MRPAARLLLTTTAVVLSSGLGASTGRAESPAAQAPSQRVRLPDGLTVLVRENPAVPAVAASLFVRVGGRWETEDNAGITNLLQHVLVKGTTRRSALEIAETAERLGGQISASGDTDFSEVRGAALSRHWTGLLELVADVALRPSLPEGEIDNERRVILRTIRNRQDQPFPLAFDTLMERLYGGHPSGRPVVGRASVLERFDRPALLAHYQRFYRAGRMILSVSGDVSTEAVVAHAARLFSEVAPGDGGPDAVPPRAAAFGDRTALVRPSAQAQILIGFLAPAMAHPDYAAVKVLSTALGGGMAGRLFTELRDKQGLAYSTAASYPSRVGPSFFLAQIGTAPASAARAEEAMKGEIERLRRDRVGEGELERAKMFLLGQFALDRRTNVRLAWYGAFFESAGAGQDFADRYARAVEAVSAADVQRVATIYLASPTVVTVGPGAQ